MQFRFGCSLFGLFCNPRTTIISGGRHLFPPPTATQLPMLGLPFLWPTLKRWSFRTALSPLGQTELSVLPSLQDCPYKTFSNQYANCCEPVQYFSKPTSTTIHTSRSNVGTPNPPLLIPLTCSLHPCLHCNATYIPVLFSKPISTKWYFQPSFYKPSSPTLLTSKSNGGAPDPPCLLLSIWSLCPCPHSNYIHVPVLPSKPISTKCNFQPSFFKPDSQYSQSLPFKPRSTSQTLPFSLLVRFITHQWLFCCKSKFLSLL